MNGLENLLLTYAGAMMINAIVSALLWFHNRTDLHRALFLVWAASLVAFVGQGVLSEGDLAITIGFSFVFLIGASLARLIGEVSEIEVPWRPSLALLLAAYPVSIGATFLGASFFWIAAPISIAVAFPMAYAVARVFLDGKWAGLTISGRGLVLSMVAYGLHVLDFPFLRDKPEFAALGFTIAILIVFALSIFAPAVVMEIVTGKQARVAAEMEVAHRIQMEILPPQPVIEGLELVCYMRPAEEVGGDYYDVYSFGQHSWVLLGDVTGHGLSSGLVMLMAQSIISAILHTRPEISPGELNFVANHILFQNLRRLDEQRSMTMVAICRTGDDNHFLYCGSHESLYVFRAETGAVEILDVSQAPHGLGMLDEFAREEYSESRFTLAEDDLLFIASDGIREAPRLGDYNKGMYEEERLITFLKASKGRSLDELKTSLLAEVEQFTGGRYFDDITFVMVRATRA